MEECGLRRFDSSADKIIGNSIPVDFVLSDEVVDYVCTAFGCERDNRYKYTIISRNGHDWLCAVKDEHEIGSDEYGYPIDRSRKNVLQEVYCLTDLKDNDELEKYQKIIDFKDFCSNNKRIRIKSSILYYATWVLSISVTAYVLFVIWYYCKIKYGG